MTKLPKNVNLTALHLPTPLQQIRQSLLEEKRVKLFIKRDDLIHPTVSGNKYRKLKYNLLDAKSRNFEVLLTFGGAYSNHLYATAAAGAALGFQTIGIVRGEDHEQNESATILFCREMGMDVRYVSRQEYRLRNAADYLEKLKLDFNDPYIIPEGGTSELSLPGVREVVTEVEGQLSFLPDYFAVACGTGGTAAGVLSGGADVLAFSALKGGGFLQKDIANLIANSELSGKLTLFTDYHFGGYARHSPELLNFINEFKTSHKIQLDQVYTGKMLYGLFDLITKDYFKQGTTIVAVHTGGLQGLLPELR